MLGGVTRGFLARESKTNSAVIRPPFAIGCCLSAKARSHGRTTIARAQQGLSRRWTGQCDNCRSVIRKPSPSAFKGFENQSATPTCGSTWTSQPGNRSNLPPTVPQFMASNYVELGGTERVRYYWERKKDNRGPNQSRLWIITRALGQRSGRRGPLQLTLIYCCQ